MSSSSTSVQHQQGSPVPNNSYPPHLAQFQLASPYPPPASASAPASARAPPVGGLREESYEEDQLAGDQSGDVEMRGGAGDTISRRHDININLSSVAGAGASGSGNGEAAAQYGGGHGQAGSGEGGRKFTDLLALSRSAASGLDGFGMDPLDRSSNALLDPNAEEGKDKRRKRRGTSCVACRACEPWNRKAVAGTNEDATMNSADEELAFSDNAPEGSIVGNAASSPHPSAPNLNHNQNQQSDIPVQIQGLVPHSNSLLDPILQPPPASNLPPPTSQSVNQNPSSVPVVKAERTSETMSESSISPGGAPSHLSQEGRPPSSHSEPQTSSTYQPLSSSLPTSSSLPEREATNSADNLGSNPGKKKSRKSRASELNGNSASKASKPRPRPIAPLPNRASPTVPGTTPTLATVPLSSATAPTQNFNGNFVVGSMLPPPFLGSASMTNPAMNVSGPVQGGKTMLPISSYYRDQPPTPSSTTFSPSASASLPPTGTSITLPAAPLPAMTMSAPASDAAPLQVSQSQAPLPTPLAPGANTIDDRLAAPMKPVMAVPTDVLAVKDAVFLFFNLPGVKKNQIDLRLEKDQLVVSGDFSAPSEYSFLPRAFFDRTRPQPLPVNFAVPSNPMSVAELNWLGRAFGRFEQVVKLEHGASYRCEEAKFEDGVLRVRLKRMDDTNKIRIE
ncbi:hypothetical protein BT69DRAFT_1332918 [Atractiella rhizophila]|nr:hypothetical protein BT69DRAFT_1332918 [Atractiella rhizophila]